MQNKDWAVGEGQKDFFEPIEVAEVLADGPGVVWMKEQSLTAEMKRRDKLSSQLLNMPTMKL